MTPFEFKTDFSQLARFYLTADHSERFCASAEAVADLYRTQM